MDRLSKNIQFYIIILQFVFVHYFICFLILNYCYLHYEGTIAYIVAIIATEIAVAVSAIVQRPRS